MDYNDHTSSFFLYIPVNLIMTSVFSVTGMMAKGSTVFRVVNYYESAIYNI